MRFQVIVLEQTRVIREPNLGEHPVVGVKRVISTQITFVPFQDLVGEEPCVDTANYLSVELVITTVDLTSGSIVAD